MIHSERIRTTNYLNEHLLLRAPYIILPDGRRAIDLNNYTDPTLLPVAEYGQWVSCPDWRLMRAGPGGEYWHCPHGVYHPHPSGSPEIIPWGVAAATYGEHPDYRDRHEVNHQAYMAEVLALAAFGAVGTPDEPRLGQVDLAPNQIHKLLRLGVGLYLDANRWRQKQPPHYERNYYDFLAPVAAGIAAAATAYQARQWI